MRSGRLFTARENEVQFFLVTPEERAARAVAAAGTDQEGAIEAYIKLAQQSNGHALSTSWLEAWRQKLSDRPVTLKCTTVADLARIQARLQICEDL